MSGTASDWEMRAMDAEQRLAIALAERDRAREALEEVGPGLLVLRNMLKVAGLTLGYQRAVELIEKVKPLIAGDKTHDWFTPEFIGYECCRTCGIVRRSDHQNKACKGPVAVGPRALTPAPIPEQEE